MKNINKKRTLPFLSSLLLSFILMSCEDVIQLEGVKSESLLVVDAMITNQSGERRLKSVPASPVDDAVWRCTSAPLSDVAGH